MVILGIVLIVLAVVLGLGVSVSSADSTTLEVFGVNFGVVVPTVFFLGAAAGAALIIGLWLTKKGLGRGYRRHKEVRELRQQVDASATSGDSKAAADTAPELAAAPGDDGDERLAAEPHTVADRPESPPATHRRRGSE
ncbi:MAG: hypothetical protein QOG10_1067 [Kribbellaceae bacterium]|jgi:hypothetical protein|nr:hypothetical protein [Kribbellaceae bacterium]